MKIKATCAHCSEQFYVEKEAMKSYVCYGVVNGKQKTLYITTYDCAGCGERLLAQVDNEDTLIHVKNMERIFSQLSKLRARGYVGKKLKHLAEDMKYTNKLLNEKRARLQKSCGGKTVWLADDIEYTIPFAVNVYVVEECEDDIQSKIPPS